ncbi:MAG TPA: HNH endonuclease [Pirellulales bacterium]
MKFELEPYNRDAGDDVLLDDLRAVADSLGKSYVTKDEYNGRGRFCASTLQKRFGSWCKAHDLAGLRRIRNYDATAEDCIADIRRAANELGVTTLTEPEYERSGKFSVSLIVRGCGSWEAATERAGIPTVSPNKRASDEQPLENLERLWESLGRQPKKDDFAKPLSNYSASCYARRFGSLRKALEAFVASFENDGPDRLEDAPIENAARTSPVAAASRRKTSRTVNWRMRFLVMRRDDFKCCICGANPALTPGAVLVVDHVVPWSGGGETVVENLQTLCERRNSGKSDLAMKTGGEKTGHSGL